MDAAAAEANLFYLKAESAAADAAMAAVPLAAAAVPLAVRAAVVQVEVFDLASGELDEAEFDIFPEVQVDQVPLIEEIANFPVEQVKGFEFLLKQPAVEEQLSLEQLAVDGQLLEVEEQLFPEQLFLEQLGVEGHLVGAACSGHSGRLLSVGPH